MPAAPAHRCRLPARWRPRPLSLRRCLVRACGKCCTEASEQGGAAAAQRRVGCDGWCWSWRSWSSRCPPGRTPRRPRTWPRCRSRAGDRRLPRPVDGVAGPATTAPSPRFQRRKGSWQKAARAPRPAARSGAGDPGGATAPLVPGMKGWTWPCCSSSSPAGACPPATSTAASVPAAGRPATLPDLGRRSHGRSCRAGTSARAAGDHRPLRCASTGPSTARSASLRPPRQPLPARYRLHRRRRCRCRAADRGRAQAGRLGRGRLRHVIVIEHRLGVTSWYARLSSIAVRPGPCVTSGDLVGRVGSTGRSYGPHAHFELRVQDAVVDPGPAVPVAPLRSYKA